MTGPSGMPDRVRHDEDPDTFPPATNLRLREIATMLPNAWRLLVKPTPLGPRDGPKCLVVPGFLAHDRSTLRLREALAAAGWRVHGWKAGVNLGARADTLDRLTRRLDKLSRHGPVLLVGWSLGGVYARELAHRHPGRIAAVVTLGSPFSGDPTWNNVWRTYERIAGHPVTSPPIARTPGKPPVPTLALWSRCDGIVAPRAAYGLDDERDSAVELACNHLGFVVTRAGAEAVVAAITTFLRASARA
ncbi:alpha/beta fold hydrolase [Sphingomonas sp. LHG3406-1]|uniref:alpha/beta hydrolase n=1 Tax=Sphingomonas sp. LHG3406-1 TaxID=2804617 RepID=UPI002634AF05|nr:alpha/beta fold hydrolase [Sphingomonas sp. LHG3406-1]